MNTDPTRLSAAELAHAIASKELSSVEVVQAHLDRIAAVDADVHAFLHVDGDLRHRAHLSPAGPAHGRSVVPRTSCHGGDDPDAR